MYIYFWVFLIFILSLAIAGVFVLIDSSKEKQCKGNEMREYYDSQFKNINEKLITLEEQLKEMKEIQE